MGKIFKRIILILIIIGAWEFLAIRPVPAKITYGVSFSKFHSDELQLDWKKTYLSILDDLKVKNLRLSAHWPMIQPTVNKYNFEEIDFQMEEAKKRNVSVILAVGRRLPGWPECHVPQWAAKLPESEQREKIIQMIKTLVKRYKDYPNLKYWQVENEPFLGLFGRSHCGQPDEDFLKQEIDLVHKDDPGHPVLVTDSGELGTWYQSYRNSDIFGTSMYLYIWSTVLGPIRYPIGPSFFRVKQKIIEALKGDKPKILIELSAEPWLLEPIIDTPIETQLDRMGIDKFNEMIKFSAKAGFDTQYLWGAEWWYWMNEHNRPEFWQRAKEIFKQI